VRIAVCQPQVPFERGGTEVLTRSLVEQLRQRGHEADLLTVPFKWYPGARVLSQALVWRLLDVEEANGRPIDLVVATKFPSYAVRHPKKVVWLFHQFRQAYDLHGTELGQFGDDPAGVAARRAIERLDRTTLGEARRLFAISGNVAERLQSSTGLQAEVLYPPPPSLSFRFEEYGDFILSVGRLDRAKRVDLLLEAAARGDGLRVVVAGDGPDRHRLEALARELGLDGRVTFAGRVADDDLTDLYARCLAVYYAPVDEDYGLVPYEALLSRKPVVTTFDAGGPLEIVVDGETGRVCEPTPDAVAEACLWFGAHRDTTRALGLAGQERARGVTWDRVVKSLLAP
jgi:glycosyltransferase involved in cell wall biosynthesis